MIDVKIKNLRLRTHYSFLDVLEEIGWLLLPTRHGVNDIDLSLATRWREKLVIK